jgi:hypothetical protein
LAHANFITESYARNYRRLPNMAQSPLPTPYWASHAVARRRLPQSTTVRGRGHDISEPDRKYLLFVSVKPAKSDSEIVWRQTLVSTERLPPLNGTPFASSAARFSYRTIRPGGRACDGNTQSVSGQQDFKQTDPPKANKATD